MGRPLGKNGCKLAKRAEVEKTTRTQENGKATVEMGGLHEKIGGG